MTQETFNNPLLNGWLKVYTLINVIFLIYLWGYYLIGGLQSPNLSIETSLCTILCITNIVGIIYLTRNLRLGVYILLFVPIVILLIQFIIIDKISISIYSSILLSIITCLLLFFKSGNSSIWSQMKDGVDIKHFRHIHQLSTILILIVTSYGIYNYVTLTDNFSGKEMYNEDLPDNATMEELLRELDKPTITLGKVSKIEKRVKELPPEYEARIMALRHILAGHIVPNNHNTQSFKMAYFLRKDAMSKEQQDILDWFFRQDNDVMEIWRTSDGCSNLATFKEYIKDIIVKRKLTEY